MVSIWFRSGIDATADRERRMKHRVVGFYNSSGSWGGLEMNHFKRCLWLKERGHSVYFFCVQNSPIEKEIKEHGIPYSNVPRNKRKFAVGEGKQLSKLIAEHGIEILVATDNRDLSTITWAKRWTGNKLKLAFYQGMMLGVPKKDPFQTSIFNKMDAWFSPLPYLADQMKQMTNIKHSKVKEVLSSIEVESLKGLDQEMSRKELDLPQNATIIGIIGRFDPQKGQLLGLKAFLELATRFPNAHYVMMGESTRGEGDDYFREIKELSESSGLKDRIHFRPFNSNIAPFFGAIDIFLLASSGETYGMVTVEALCSGKTVIGTNAGGTPALLKDGEWGHLFEPGNLPSLVEQMSKVLSQNTPFHRQEIEDQAQQRFSHHKECELVEKIFEELLG